MAVHRKTYRFRMRPTRVQEQALLRFAGARRWVWNWALARKRDHYAETGKSLSYVALSAELTVLKRQPEMAWLREISRGPLEHALRDLDRAFVAFFEKRTRFPRFRSRKRDTPRFRSSEQAASVRDGKVYVPRIGLIRIRQSRPVNLPTKSATFKRDAFGRWFVTLVAEFEMPDAPLPSPDPSKVVGIDLGLKDFIVTSDGARVAAPKFYRKAQRRLARAQRVLSRRKPGSNRRAKAKARVGRLYARIADQRSDFLHKLTTDLVRSHDGLCIEDLSLKGMARTKLAKSVYDASMGEFRRQLTYKCEWNRKHLAIVDRWYPSTKTCGTCGRINDRLTLKDRTWSCECGAIVDRDLNAACNIKSEGLRHLAAGDAERLNARGRPVRPAKAGKAG